MQPGAFTITPSGPFSLAEAATFGFGQRPGGSWDGVMRLAFCLDGYAGQVGVEVRQDEAGQPDETGPPDQAGTVRCLVHGPAGTDLGRVRDQVARVLSLDHDGQEFTRVGERDPVIGRLQAAAPGLRPPLFYSPYEAAAWCVLSARRPARQMMQARDRLSRAHGQVFDLAGEQVAALPTPGQLLAIDSFPGIPADRMPRLHGVARAALDGQLDAARLLDQGPEQAMASLQALDGIGPFYSSLIVVRGTGFTDVLPVNEPRVLDLAGRLYQLDVPPSAAEFRTLAQPWKPLRTWAVVLIRAAAPRVLGDAGPEQAGAPASVR
jgi:DNA-3-methyladenine glycosylase II